MRKVAIIDVTPAPCSLCGKMAELRPYGPEWAVICFECMEKDGVEARKRMEQFIGEHDDVILKEGKKTIGYYHSSPKEGEIERR